MKGQLFEVTRIPKRLRDTTCLMTQYEADGSPTEKTADAEFKVTILLRPNSTYYGHTFTYCRHHLAQLTMEVEKHATQALRKRGR